jgi:hypothetical protein
LIFDVTWTLELLNLREVVKASISKKLRSTTNFDTINRYIMMAIDIQNTPQLSSHFLDDTMFLQCKKEKQKVTLRMLRDPKTRGRISEKAYQSFLDAAEASSWTQQKTKVCPSEAVPGPRALSWNDDESE